MQEETDGKILHDRATRGDILSSEEKASLDEWYDKMDAAEFELLNVDDDVEKMDIPRKTLMT